jgi:hypothetical protein
MDSFQSPSPNDQRRLSTTELTIGVNPAEPNAPSPDAAPQPAPVNQTTPVPSARTLELMRQLEALAHEVALVSRGDSSKQCIKVQEGSNLSAGLHRVEPSIRMSPRDQLATDSPLLGRRANLTLASFFTSARDRLGSYKPSFDGLSATLAGFFTAARGWLASSRTSLGRSSDALAGLFIAARDWLASRRPSFGKPSPTLANFFVAARDQLASYRPSIDRRTFLTLTIFIATLIGVAATFVWQSRLDHEVAERRRRCRKAIRRYACRSGAAAKFATATSACHSDCTSAHRARSRRARAARCQARTD